MTVSNCSFVVVNSFLKEKCLINNQWYFKCSNSYRFYQLKSTSTCQNTTFTRVCPNDATFYQACGHNQYKCKVIRNEDSKRAEILNFPFGQSVAACGDLICQLRRSNMNIDSKYCQISAANIWVKSYLLTTVFIWFCQLSSHPNKKVASHVDESVNTESKRIRNVFQGLHTKQNLWTWKR